MSLKQLGMMGNCFGKRGKGNQSATLAILGLDNAGKTVTTKGLKGEPLDTVAPTIGFSSVDFRFGKFNITLFDLGGGSRIRGIWKNYFEEVYGIIYVIDSSEPDRIEECATVLKGLLEHPKISGKPILVLANKQDVKGAMDEIDVCEGLRLEEMVNMNKCPCRLEMCSAVLGQGKRLDRSIREGMNWLLASIRENWEAIDDRVKADVDERKERDQREKKERVERVKKIREERAKKEREERIARGENPDEEEEEDMTDGGPFKRLDINELTKKEQMMKEEKRLQKELKKQKEQAALKEENGRDTKNTSRQRRKLDSTGTDEESEEKPPPLSGRLPPLRMEDRSPRYPAQHKQSSDDDDDDDGMEVRHSKKHHHHHHHRRSLNEEEDRHHRKKKHRNRHSLDDGENLESPKLKTSSADYYSIERKSAESRTTQEESAEEGDENVIGYSVEKRTKKTTPRPGDLGHYGDNENEAPRDIFSISPIKRGGALTPIGHVSQLEPIDHLAESSKIKKKKRKAKKNQTMPAPFHEDAPAGWPGNSPTRASKSPTLSKMREEEEEEDVFSTKWGLLNEDLTPEQPQPTRLSRPNSEYDDEIIT